MFGYNCESFWGNVDYPSNESAKQARDTRARELRKLGHTVRCGRITNQLRKYSGLGQPDGRIGHVYEVHYS
jgi:hypothetical protein